MTEEEKKTLVDAVNCKYPHQNLTEIYYNIGRALPFTAQRFPDGRVSDWYRNQYVEVVRVEPHGRGGKFGNVFGFYYRNGERADAYENDPEHSWCTKDDTEPQPIPCCGCGSWMLFDYTSNEALHLSAAEVNIFRDVLSMIKQELQHPIDKHSRELIVSNIELLLNYCLRFYDRQFITREEINHSVVKKFISLLDEYIARKAIREGLPTVAYFADKCCYSSKYFGELVKTETGRTAKSMINDRLLSFSRQLLADETLSITQVSQRLGFEYPQHFVRFFKAQTGKTPSEYRKTA